MGKAHTTASSGALHENLRQEEYTTASSRSFGLVMAGFFGVVTGIKYWRTETISLWAAGLSAGFLACTLIRPSVLDVPNKLWTKLGLLLHSVVNPIIMGLMFYGAILPTGVIMRALGKDLLKVKMDSGAETYWITRQPSGPSPDSFKDPF